MTRQPPSKRRPRPKQSRVISIRLHPAYENEKQALEKWDAQISTGREPRDVFAEAMNNMNGRGD